MNPKNAQLVAGLRQLCEFIEANDDVEFVLDDQPVAILYWRDYLLFNKLAEEKRAILADLARRLGNCDKSYTDEVFWLRHNFGPYVQLEVSAIRSLVCERFVVGKKIIPARPERVIPAEPEREVEVVEWRCDPILRVNSEEVQ